MESRTLDKRESRQRIREMREQWMWWDPIGVRGVVEAVDEYDGYLAPTLRLLERGASDEEIAAYLDWVALEYMGLPTVPVPSVDFARRLRAWFATNWKGTRVPGA